MPDLKLISPHQFFLYFFITSFLQFEFEVRFKALRNNGESAKLPIIPFEAIRIESVYLMEFDLFELLAFDG